MAGRTERVRQNKTARLTQPRRLPLTRGECEGGIRPCPYVTCVHHLYLDVNPDNGSIKYNYPGKEPHELEHSCSLDVNGELDLSEVGKRLNITKEAVRRTEGVALNKLR